jgi:hypothetical protein
MSPLLRDEDLDLTINELMRIRERPAARNAPGFKSSKAQGLKGSNVQKFSRSKVQKVKGSKAKKTR